MGRRRFLIREIVDCERAWEALGYNSNDSADSHNNSEEDSEIDAADIGEDYIPSEDENSG